MGTRSTIKFYEGDRYLCGIYQQYDGYLSGVGEELYDFLKNIKLINGIGFNQNTLYDYANGFGDLVAQFIEKHKTEVGGLYITTEDDSQEYNYTVYIDSWDSTDIRIKVETYDEKYDFNLDKFKILIDNENEDE